MKIFGREPALIIAFIGAGLTWAAGLNLDWLNAGQAAAITTAITGVAIAATTRPVAPGLFVAAFGAVASLVGQYGLHWSEVSVSTFGAVILAGFALLGVRPAVTPNADPAPTALNTGQVR